MMDEVESRHTSDTTSTTSEDRVTIQAVHTTQETETPVNPEGVLYQDKEIIVEEVRIPGDSGETVDAAEAASERTAEAKEPDDPNRGEIEVVEDGVEAPPDVAAMARKIGTMSELLVDTLEDTMDGSVDDNQLNEIIESIKDELDRLSNTIRRLEQAGHASHRDLTAQAGELRERLLWIQRVHPGIDAPTRDGSAVQEPIHQLAITFGFDADGDPETLEYFWTIVLDQKTGASHVPPHLRLTAERAVQAALHHWRAGGGESKKLADPLDLAV